MARYIVFLVNLFQPTQCGKTYFVLRTALQKAPLHFMKKTKFIHVHRHRILQHGLAFDFTTTFPSAQFGVTLIGNPDDNEERCYEIRFTHNATVAVTHVESKRTDTVISIYPSGDDFQVQEKSTVFPTHVVTNESTVILNLTNVQLRGDVNVPIWVPNFYLQFFINREVNNRYVALKFINPLEVTNAVDLSLVPQRMRITA